MNKIVKVNEVKNVFYDGMSMMIGGFMGCGTPDLLINFILELGIKDITLISTDTATPDIGIGKLIKNNRVKKLYASHIGLNPLTGKQMNEKTLNVELIPQGTLAERIRCGGYGLGGVLTQVGLGTAVEEGKQIIEVDGEKFLLETPIKADVALIKADVSDEHGNLIYNGTANNFNEMMATAASTVIVQVEKTVKTGELDKSSIATPGIYIDYIVEKEN